jgi:hypothetical protein
MARAQFKLSARLAESAERAPPKVHTSQNTLPLPLTPCACCRRPPCARCRVRAGPGGRARRGPRPARGGPMQCAGRSGKLASAAEPLTQLPSPLTPILARRAPQARSRPPCARPHSAPAAPWSPRPRPVPPPSTPSLVRVCRFRSGGLHRAAGAWQHTAAQRARHLGSGKCVAALADARHAHLVPRRSQAPSRRPGRRRWRPRWCGPRSSSATERAARATTAHAGLARAL